MRCSAQEACTCHFVQWAAVAALTDPAAMEDNRNIVAVLRERRDALVPLINEVTDACAVISLHSCMLIVADSGLAMSHARGNLLSLHQRYRSDEHAWLWHQRGGRLNLVGARLYLSTSLAGVPQTSSRGYGSVLLYQGSLWPTPARRGAG